MYWLKRGTLVLALLSVASFIAWFVPQALDPTSHGPARQARDRLWVSSSPYWIDRQFCSWLSLCGLHHLRRDPASLQGGNTSPGDGDVGHELRKRSAEALAWEDVASDAPSRFRARRHDKNRNTFERRKSLKGVPDYVLQHAPLVHLYSGEQFWPSDIREHVKHMEVVVDDEPVNVTDNKLTLDNLDMLNMYEGVVTLHSLDDVESRPTWLHSHDNAPTPFDDDDEDGEDGDGNDNKNTSPKQPPSRSGGTSWWDVNKDQPLHRISGPQPHGQGRNSQSGRQKPLFDEAALAEKIRLSRRGHKPDASGYSRAPAILVLVDKGSGILDAFWFFFYSYNLGQTVLGIRFGNHIGDWEHCMVRFENGVPRGIFFSEHEGGQAYAWDAVEKRGERPVIYSAVGSHAMYPTPGEHPYVLPFKMLKDVTDKGPLWDPAMNNYAYHYDYRLENHTWMDEEIFKEPHQPYDFKAEKLAWLEQQSAGDDEKPPSLIPAATNPDAPTAWFHYNGYWGDRLYSLADLRQWRLFGQYHYVTGPTGPKYKRLNRAKMCQIRRCRILYKLDPKGTWY